MEILNKLLAINFNYILIVFIAVFYSLEQIMSTQFEFSKRPLHLLNNILFQLTVFLGNLAWVGVTVFCIEWLNKHEVGFFYLVHVPYWIKLILAVVMYDFTSYWFHRTAHKVPLIWRFHRVHHSDTTLDSSSNFRGHPLESFFWFGVSNIVAAAVFGLDLVSLGLYFLIITPILFIEHSNLRFPTWLDKTVGLVITTPNIHKIHHDQDQNYTDSNFADIFIVWDRLFGTFKYKPPGQINFGLKEFDDPKKQSFWYLMICPFINIRRTSSDELTGIAEKPE